MITARVLLFLLCFVLPATMTTLLACKVTQSGADKTSDFLVIDSIAGEAYIDCMGPYKCRDAVITDCPVVKCFGNEACNSAQIINFTDSVLCEGLHACHRTEIVAAPAAVEDKHSAQQSVSCIGSGACDVAHIVGNIKQVACTGVKSCRKVHVEGSRLVKCHDGHGQSLACQGFATLETECLYCGKNGCADHINMCRYNIIGEDDVESSSFKKCQPETIIGKKCPAGLEAELQSELSGKEELDVTGRESGGARRMMRRRFLGA